MTKQSTVKKKGDWITWLKLIPNPRRRFVKLHIKELIRVGYLTKEGALKAVKRVIRI